MNWMHYFCKTFKVCLSSRLSFNTISIIKDLIFWRNLFYKMHQIMFIKTQKSRSTRTENILARHRQGGKWEKRGDSTLSHYRKHLKFASFAEIRMHLRFSSWFLFSSLLLFSFSTGNLLVKINERRSSRHYIFPDYPTISYTQKHSTPSIFMTHLCDNALSKILRTLHFFSKVRYIWEQTNALWIVFSKCV